MVRKYTRVLEEREVNAKTGETWKITDVPTTWRTKVTNQVLADGYVINEDGTVSKDESDGNDTDSE